MSEQKWSGEDRRKQAEHYAGLAQQLADERDARLWREHGTQLMVGAKAVLTSWQADEKYVTSPYMELGSYWSPAASMVDSYEIFKLRAAYDAALSATQRGEG